MTKSLHLIYDASNLLYNITEKTITNTFKYVYQFKIFIRQCARLFDIAEVSMFGYWTWKCVPKQLGIFTCS